ncbi:MAG: DUF1194 domain-containing protein [Roseitalea sp.]|nr:DUF1194 domain-containing protein [Roseitalea sp.]MBO6721266.1 DUF1194 domain-containing protein [Roseitalea sp.]MBO6742250.1 DUF1194 domain-containing protein [Roseitalea sp.]
MTYHGLMKALLLRFVALVMLLVPAAGQVWAQDRQVDVELVLAVDVSGSMRDHELALQRRGYAEAFRTKAVHDAIAGGLIGEVAVTYVEWARVDLQRVIVPWTVIGDAEGAHAFADRLEQAPIANMRNTSITGAILYGIAAIEENAYEGLRRVIDISGDGPNNQGGRVDVARDEAIDRGIVINGLPIMAEPWMGGLGFNISGLDVYYRDCVIGGPGAFLLPVRDWDEFPEAVRRKIVLELAGKTPAITESAGQAMPVHLINDGPVDCTIGERLRGIREVR